VLAPRHFAAKFQFNIFVSLRATKFVLSLANVFAPCFPQVFYKEKEVLLLMKLGKLIVGILVIALAALLLANAVITNVDPANQIFSQNVVNIIISLVLIILAAEYFSEAKK
jgi:hypothetical protein